MAHDLRKLRCEIINAWEHIAWDFENHFNEKEQEEVMTPAGQYQMDLELLWLNYLPIIDDSD